VIATVKAILFAVATLLLGCGCGTFDPASVPVVGGVIRSAGLGNPVNGAAAKNRAPVMERATVMRPPLYPDFSQQLTPQESMARMSYIESYYNELDYIAGRQQALYLKYPPSPWGQASGGLGFGGGGNSGGGFAGPFALGFGTGWFGRSAAEVVR